MKPKETLNNEIRNKIIFIIKLKSNEKKNLEKLTSRDKKKVINLVLFF